MGRGRRGFPPSVFPFILPGKFEVPREGNDGDLRGKGKSEER